MKTVIGFFVAVVVIAAAASYCTLQWAHHRPAATVESHEWLHKELGITPEQAKALEPIEAKFAERERALRERMRAANRELAAAIGKSKNASPEVSAAVEKVHHEMGELQKASIEHLYEMRAVLTPEQSDRLLQFAQKALQEAP
jgi:Spy/CpxP family protein refolding chaperone